MPDLKNRTLFVIHGRDDRLRSSLFDFLRSIGLRPLEWSQAIALTGKGSPYIGEVLNTAFANAQAVLAVLSGDDEARLRRDLRREDDPGYEKQLTPQARPNVLFEAGMALATHPDNTVLVQVGDVRPFSDVAGRHILRLTNSSESRQDVADRLANAGCLVDLTGRDWHRTGDFTAPERSPEPTSALEEQELPQGQLRVLRFLAAVEAKNADPLVSVGLVAQELSITRVLAQHLLDELGNLDMTSYTYDFMDDVHLYSLSSTGRSYLFRRGLI